MPLFCFGERIPTGFALVMTDIVRLAYLHGHCEEGVIPDVAIRIFFLQLPVDGRQAVLLQEGICLGEMAAAEEAVVGG